MEFTLATKDMTARRVNANGADTLRRSIKVRRIVRETKRCGCRTESVSEIGRSRISTYPCEEHVVDRIFKELAKMFLKRPDLPPD